MASPGFSPISEDGEVGETPQEGTPSLPPSAFAAVAAAAAALSAPTLPLSDEADAFPVATTGSGFGVDGQSAETGALELGGPSWGPPGTVLLLPSTVAAPSLMQQTESNEFKTASAARRSADTFSMEVDAVTPIGAPASSPQGIASELLHPDRTNTPTSASPSAHQHLAAGDIGKTVSSPAPAPGSSSWQHQQPQQAISGLAAGFSTERIAAVLATVDSRQASVETAANFIYRFAAAVPPPHVAAAAAEAATHAAGIASKEAAAAAAVASPGVPPSPIALRALTRTAGANAAAAAAAAAGALPLSICYLMLDSYRRSQPKHRLAVFYVFHRLMHLSSAARGGVDAHVPPGSIEDAGYSVFVLPVVQELSKPEMDSVRHKMLRCMGIWREWRVYTPAALRHIRQLAAKGVSSSHASERGEAAADEAWAALLQLQTLRFLAQTPSGRKAYVYACQCFNRIYRDSLPVGVEILREAAEAATDGNSTSLVSLPQAGTSAATSNGLEDAVLKRQRDSSGAWQEVQHISSVQTKDASGTEGESEDVSFVSKTFSISALRLLNDEQLAACGKLFDRASRVTGQEYLLLQSSLMDLSGLLQMQHQRLLELREEMQQFAAAEAADTTAAPSEQQQKEDILV